MLETEWLATDDVGRMLAFVTGGYHDGSPGTDEARRRGSPRRLRLFACAVCRQAWGGVPCGRCDDGRMYAGQSAYPCKYCNGTGKVGGLTDPRSRRAVETVERHADGLATDDELAAACRFAGEVAEPSDDASWWAYVWAAGGHVEQASGRVECVPPAVQAGLLRDVCGNPFRPVAVSEAWLTPDVRALARAAYDERGGEECEKCRGCRKLFRCRMCRGLWPTRQSEGLCVGCLHKGERVRLEPPADCPDCGGTGFVVTTGHLDPVRLALLADALEEAGCTDAALLAHLRGWETVPLRGPHVRGCHALDAVLGLS